MSAILILSSIFGYLTSITNFISSNYFGSAYTSSNSIVWFPELNYISGFIIGASLLSFYIYLTYYNSKNPEDINQKYSFYGSIFAGSGLMAMGRIVYLYGGEEAAKTVQTGLIDIINAFPIVITIILFQKTANESSGHPSENWLKLV